ncbi:hypothetical protein AA313_de0209294 [Arthrobotrys entomopaga]|nr:hypothetical protein AA313_de0209294 [Arthrobotrys entomopaga]
MSIHIKDKLKPGPAVLKPEFRMTSLGLRNTSNFVRVYRKLNLSSFLTISKHNTEKPFEFVRTNNARFLRGLLNWAHTCEFKLLKCKYCKFVKARVKFRVKFSSRHSLYAS